MLSFKPIIVYAALSVALSHAIILPEQPNILPEPFHLDPNQAQTQPRPVPGKRSDPTDDSNLPRGYLNGLGLILGQSEDKEGMVMNICPELKVNCVVDGDWRHPIGSLGPKPFCRAGIRCNQCEETRNTRECNRTFKEECKGACEAYGPIPF